MSRYDCGTCGDWGTLDPGSAGAKSEAMDPTAVGAGLTYCPDCPLGHRLAAGQPAADQDETTAAQGRATSQDAEESPR